MLVPFSSRVGILLIVFFHFHLNADTLLYSCRRNNKREKRKRNKEYSRKFKTTTGGARKKVVVEQKRQVVSSNEDNFQAGVFKMTTDDDMPAYSGFDFV